MSLVSRSSDSLRVMYAGEVGGRGPTQQLFNSPAHPYTVGLMDAFPSIRGPRRPLKGIPGHPPDLARPPFGCRFAPRCPKVMPRCTAEPPGLYHPDGIEVRCFLYHPSAPATDGSTP